MKKSGYLTLFALLLAMGIFGQSQRLVLLEHFTQASCPPCATWNPVIQNILDNNPDKITAIKYHTSWPGYDPMHNHNPEDPNARVSYYNVSAVPHSVLDGNFYSGHPNGWNINSVNTRYAVPSPFELSLHQEIPPSEDMVTMTMLIQASDNVTGDLLGFIAVIEEEIEFTSPPGSNQEKIFHSVLKKLLPKKSGAGLPTSFEPGDYVILQSSWEFANVYEVDQIAGVCFVQDNGTKEVHQAANSSETMFTPPFTNDAEVMEIMNVSASNCLGTIHPEIMIRNNGSANLTTLDIHYSVNGETPVSYQWSGDLAFLESETVVLDESTFSIMDDNLLQVYAENPNGLADDYPKNDTMNLEFDRAHQLENSLRILIITDQMPQETTWEVTNAAGDVVFSGGPYTDPGTIHEEIYEVTDPDCYKFTIFDSGGNGLCCENGQGAWGVYDNNEEIDKGGMFTYRDSTCFSFGTGTGIREQGPEVGDIRVFPNPFTDLTNVMFTLSESREIRVEVTNMLGETVRLIGEEQYAPGTHNIRIAKNGLDAGIYFITLKTGQDTFTEKIFIH